MSEFNFEEVVANAAEVASDVTSDAVESIPADSIPLTDGDISEIANTAVEVAKNVEWEVDKKSLGIGFGLGAATVSAIVFVPKLINAGRKLFGELFNKDKGDSRATDGDVDNSEENNEEVIIIEEDEKDAEEK